jgi:hypothetical protein
LSHQKPEPGEVTPADEPFLQRWSRLKTVARDAERPQESCEPPAPNAAAEPVAPAQEHVAEAPELPDLGALGPDSDYSAFLSPKVDAALRRTALRKLFRSPKFNVCDGLDDYCDDFTKFAPLGGIVTADMRHQIERAARELAERAERMVADDQAPAAAPARSSHSAEPVLPGPVEPPAADEEDDAKHGPA